MEEFFEVSGGEHGGSAAAAVEGGEFVLAEFLGVVFGFEE